MFTTKEKKKKPKQITVQTPAGNYTLGGNLKKICFDQTKKSSYMLCNQADVLQILAMNIQMYLLSEKKKKKIGEKKRCLFTGCSKPNRS